MESFIDEEDAANSTPAVAVGTPDIPHATKALLAKHRDALEKDVHKICSELTQGKKISHWIWWAFPQLSKILPNLSERTEDYAMPSLDEARAYLSDRFLGPQYIQHCRLLLKHAPHKNITQEKTREAPNTGQHIIEQIMGKDHFKLRSSLTLFLLATQDETPA